MVLDVGCGPDGGYIVAPLIGFEGVGLDVSRVNIEKSNLISKMLRAVSCQYVIGDVSKMPFRDEIFDIIICRDVIEHVRDKRNAFRNMALSLNHGGKMLISTTNAFNPVLFLDDVLPKGLTTLLIRIFGGPSYYERHKRLSPWTLTRILSENGLRLDKLLMVGFPPIGKPWKYRGSTKPPRVIYVWTYFNKVTDLSPFRKLKENMLAVATRSCEPNVRKERLQ
jgi:2-polyprenyl-3-methyl-5-hydroxy-6-metoxy-1,4-benzoquinol methylase